MKTKKIILPYLPSSVKRTLEQKNKLIEKVSHGEKLNDSDYETFEISGKLRDLYKQKEHPLL